MNEINNYIKECAVARKRKDFNHANFLLQIMLEIAPNDPAVLIEQGMFYKVQNKFKSALEIFKSLLNTNKRHLALIEIAAIYIIQSNISISTYKNYETAGFLRNNALEKYKLVYTEALNDRPSLDNYKYMLFSLQGISNIYKEEKNIEESKKYMKMALELTENSSFARAYDKDDMRYSMAKLEIMDGNLFNAYDLLNQISEIAADKKYSGMLDIQEILFKCKEYDAAKEILMNVKESNSKYQSLATLYLGKVEFALQNFDEAKKHFLSLLDTNKNVKALENLVSLFLKTGDYQSALYYNFQVLDLENNRYKLQQYQEIQKVIQIRMGRDFEVNNNVKLELEKEYISQKAIAYIKRTLKDEGFQLNVSLKDLFYSLELKDEDYIKTSDQDLYIIHYPNIMSKDGENYNYMKVSTIVNTKNIIGIYPAKEYKVNDLTRVKKRLLKG